MISTFTLLSFAAASINAPAFVFDTTTDAGTRQTLANMAGLLSQCMWESGGDAPWSACDENNYTGLSTASCTQRGDQQLYTSLGGPGACEVDLGMSMTAETFASWTPGPMKCEPNTVTEGCCWWGRGAIQTTGPFNYGQLQANVVSQIEGFEHVDLCTNPEGICQNDGLKFTGALYYWTSVVQAEVCFEDSLEAYAESFDNSATASSTNCARFSAGVGGSINNGEWNRQAHGEEGRQRYFSELMSAIAKGLEHFENDATEPAPPTFECTGDEKIDRIIELAELEKNGATIRGLQHATDMETFGVYTWYGFCQGLRAFIDAAPLPVTSTTPAPETTDGDNTDGVIGCIDEGKGSGSTCSGSDNCCATGLKCYAYDKWWSGCMETCPPGWECENDVATEEPETSTTTPEELTTPEETTTTTEEATTEEATTEEATTEEATTEEATTEEATTEEATTEEATTEEATTEEATTEEVTTEEATTEEATTEEATTEEATTEEAGVPAVCEAVADSRGEGMACLSDGCCQSGLVCWTRSQWWASCWEECPKSWMDEAHPGGCQIVSPIVSRRRTSSLD